jgi:hypothetical protein
MKPRRQTTATRNARPELATHPRVAAQPVRRRGGRRANWKRRAVGIYAQPLPVRTTLDECLDDPNRNWPLAAIAAHMLKKHGYRMCLQAVSEYRRKRLEQQPSTVATAGPLGEITLQIAAPAGTRIKIVRAR